MIPSLTTENYVKAIYQLGGHIPDQVVATGAIAGQLSVSPGSVTAMLKTLRDAELVEYAPYEGVRLTGSGTNLALRVLRRHRLIELFLSQTLDLSWDEVHEEAEHMEHAVSDRLIDRIESYLGFPQTDPHGDPIPRQRWYGREVGRQSVDRVAAGRAVSADACARSIERFLAILDRIGIGIGCDRARHQAHTTRSNHDGRGQRWDHRAERASCWKTHRRCPLITIDGSP